SSRPAWPLRLVAAAGVFPLVLGLAACAESPAGNEGEPGEVTEITLVHGAGVNGAAVAALVQEFIAETGINVKEIEYGDPDFGPKIRLAQQTGNAEFDVALAIPADVFVLTD